MTDLNALRPATPDSFDRAADLLRLPQPASTGRRRAVGLAVALTLAAGACAVPVEADQTVGTVFEWTAYGSINPANYTVAALDDAVPPTRRLAIETRPAERPAVPPDHDYPPGATWTRVRYSAGVSDPDSVAALTRTMRALVGVYNLTVEPLVHAHRVPLVAAAAGRLGLAVSPGDPAISDRELQTFLDDQIERLDLPPDAMERRYPPHVERLPDSRRILRNGDAPFAMLLAPGVRIWIQPDSPVSPIQLDGIQNENFLLLKEGRWRPIDEVFDLPSPADR